MMVDPMTETASEYTARLITEVFLRRTGLVLSEVTLPSISDLAALAIRYNKMYVFVSYEVSY